MADLCEQIRDNDRFARAGHSEQDAVLRSVSQSRPDSDASSSIVDRFCIFQRLIASAGKWTRTSFRA
jgi:hypothetical protein